MQRYLVAVMLATAWTGVGGGAADPTSADAATTFCQALRLSHTRVESHAFFAVTIEHGHVSCGAVQYVIRKVLGGAGVKHGGPYAYQESWTFDGWHCGFGAGAVGCSRGTASITGEWLAYECGYRPPEATAPCIRVPNGAEVWATLNECSVTTPPFVIGVRGSMPGDGDPQNTMYMRFHLQYLTSTGEWNTVHEENEWTRVGSARTETQNGASFELEEGQYQLRGLVEFQWRSGHTVVFATTATTTGERNPADAKPAGFSAATCMIQ